MSRQASISCLLKSSALSGFMLLPLIVQAGVTSLPSGGNNSTAGSSFNLDCGDGKVLVGVAGRNGEAINRLQPRCISVTSNGFWIGDESLPTAAAGGSSGQFFSTRCPRDTAIVGLDGRYNTSINRFSLYCQSLATPVFGSVNNNVTLIVGGSVLGSQSFTATFCSSNKPARGFHGRAGASINTLGVLCHTGTTPNAQVLPSPSNVVAVNLVNPQTGPSTTQPTPYVQVQWTDQATIETGYRVRVIRSPGSIQQIAFDRPSAAGSGSRQALTITDLPSGTYRAEVCTLANSSVSQAMRCGTPTNQFTIATGSSSSNCAPTITSTERIGVGTGRVSWTHGCTNPSSFSVRLRCGNSPMGTVATTFNGAARSETFPFGVGSGVVQVCASYSGQSSTAFCSAQRAFQCN